MSKINGNVIQNNLRADVLNKASKAPGSRVTKI